MAFKINIFIKNFKYIFLFTNLIWYRDSVHHHIYMWSSLIIWISLFSLFSKNFLSNKNLPHFSLPSYINKNFKVYRIETWFYTLFLMIHIIWSKVRVRLTLLKIWLRCKIISKFWWRYIYWAWRVGCVWHALDVSIIFCLCVWFNTYCCKYYHNKKLYTFWVQ